MNRERHGRRTTEAPLVEQRAIEHIPATERHGTPWNQITLWLCNNVQINAVVTGAVVAGLGLGLMWAIVAIVVGNLVGAVFMAYHSAQGPRLGLPQMIQSRAQFGFFGALLPFTFVVLMYLGYAIEGGVVAGQALAAWTHLPRELAIVLTYLVPLVLPLMGYRLIHGASRVIVVISGVLFLALLVELAPHLGTASFSATAPAAGTVMLGISVCVGWQLTWAPYVSDYSRYLPEQTPSWITSSYTYIGSAGGGAATMLVGAAAASVDRAAMDTDPIGFLAGRFPAVAGIVMVALLLGPVPAGAEGPYGAFLTIFSAVSPDGKVRSTRMARTLFVLGFVTLATVIAILSSGSVLSLFEGVTLFVLYLLVPWTAINLTDYYLVRRGHYDIRALLSKDGRYGRFNWWAVGLYLVSIGAELPFINSAYYVGPLVDSVGGADIAWLVGLAVGGAGYYGCATVAGRHRTTTNSPAETAAPPPSTETPR